MNSVIVVLNPLTYQGISLVQ